VIREIGQTRWYDNGWSDNMKSDKGTGNGKDEIRILNTVEKERWSWRRVRISIRGCVSMLCECDNPKCEVLWGYNREEER
jgi:hypothetical protein